MGRRRFSRRRLVAGVVILWLAWCGFQVLRATTSALAGRRAIDAVKARTSVHDLATGSPTTSLHQAEVDFSRARSAAEDPLLAPWRWVPLAGRQLRAVAALSSDATTTLRVADRALGQGRALLGSHPGTGPARVASLRRLAAIAGQAYAALAPIPPVPGHLVRPLARAADEFQADLDRLRTALAHGRDGATAVADLLGRNQQYLLLVANNAEMRAGSGSWLTAGILATEDGRVSVHAITPTGDMLLPAGAVTASGDLAARWGWAEPTEDMRNLPMTPRFDATAPVAARMWEASGRGRVDGALAVDPVAMRDLLEAVGPVTVNSRKVTAGNALTYLLHDQYAGVTYASPSAARNDALATLAAAVLQEAQDRSASASELAQQLADAAAGRHLLLWSRDRRADAAWRELGAAGVMGPDDVMVSVLNRGGNKLDQYLQARVRVTPSRSAGDVVFRLAISLENATPLAGQSEYVVGPYPGSGVPVGQYGGILAVSLPRWAGRVVVDGGSGVVVAGRDGAGQVWATNIVVPVGETVRVTFTFEAAGRTGHFDVQPSARVPAADWSVPGGHFQDNTERTVSW